MRENTILNAQFNPELLKTLVLNFLYIHSKRRKLDMFILFQKCEFFYPNKVNTPPIRQFPSFQIFWSRDMSLDHD